MKNQSLARTPTERSGSAQAGTLKPVPLAARALPDGHKTPRKRLPGCLKHHP
jgi:hypothetical protein